MTTKSVITYPWKLIYDIATEKGMLFDLSVDPGENQDLTDREQQGRLVAERTLFHALAGLSETWYIQMAGGGETHTFDLEINAREGTKLGAIRLLKAVTADGHLVDIHEMADVEARPSRRSVVKIRDLRLDDEVTLAFQVDRKRIPLGFDLRIDARPATRETYLGEDLVNPGEMPFWQKAGRRISTSGGPPAGKPVPPYFLIWQSTPGHEGDTTVKLDDATRKELRALGYIQ